VGAGLDGALRVASLLPDEGVAQWIQLSIEFSPEPPYHTGNPQTASPEILNPVRLSFQKFTESRLWRSCRALQEPRRPRRHLLSSASRLPMPVDRPHVGALDRERELKSTRGILNPYPKVK
jgi:hypothetical protein